MKHFRPIKTFATWLLERVELDLLYVSGSGWGGKEHETWIQQELGLERANYGDLRANIYSHHHCGFPQEGCPSRHHFNFPSAEQADAFQAKWGGTRYTQTMKETSRRNESIEGNFTLDDLKYLYGDPLPNIIAYHVLYSTDHCGYFHDFTHMHQEWSRSWIPSAFVYRPEHYRDETREMLIWFAGVLADKVTDEDQYGWQRGWKHYGSDVWEFDDLRLAIMFKLHFGEDALPSSYRLSRDSEKLVGQLSGISHQEGKGYIWERQANIPDSRIPRAVD